MREWQGARGKQRADPEDDLKISELPEQFFDALNRQNALSKGATGAIHISTDGASSFTRCVHTSMHSYSI